MCVSDVALPYWKKYPTDAVHDDAHASMHAHACPRLTNAHIEGVLRAGYPARQRSAASGLFKGDCCAH